MNKDYRRIEKSIDYLTGNYSQQPTLAEAAAIVDLSPDHFQRIFTRWAGVSPKTFVQYLTLQTAKKSLNNKATLFDAAFDSGLSGTGRLHDLFVKIKGMTPGEFKNGGQALTLSYSIHESPFGDMMVASTSRGICKISFLEDSQTPEDILREEFPNATIEHDEKAEHADALQLFGSDVFDKPKISLHVKGTPFQINVWEALINIPVADLRSYSEVASEIGKPNASRAVGSAVAKNPVAFLIPCHRVIQATGHFGNYRWGRARKAAMIGWERAQTNQKQKIQNE